MSEMSQASAPAGGDPLDLTPDVPGIEGDALPGAEAVDTTEESGEDVPGRPMEEAGPDPSPEGGATLDPPDTIADTPDKASGVDPLQGTGTDGDLESGADPMPDMSGTS